MLVFCSGGTRTEQERGEGRPRWEGGSEWGLRLRGGPGAYLLLAQRDVRRVHQLPQGERERGGGVRGGNLPLPPPRSLPPSLAAAAAAHLDGLPELQVEGDGAGALEPGREAPPGRGRGRGGGVGGALGGSPGPAGQRLHGRGPEAEASPLSPPLPLPPPPRKLARAPLLPPPPAPVGASRGREFRRCAGASGRLRAGSAGPCAHDAPALRPLRACAGPGPPPPAPPFWSQRRRRRRRSAGGTGKEPPPPPPPQERLEVNRGKWKLFSRPGSLQTQEGKEAASSGKGLAPETRSAQELYALTMFWKFDLNATSHVEKLLEKEDVTLQELMDEDDLLQECKAQNRKLVDFLCQQHCMEELVSLITHEPPLDMDEKVRFKYPNTACELLTSDVPQINDKLGGDEALMSILYNFLEHEPPLNPLLASFFSKTIGNLIARKTEQVIVFLRKKDQFIDLVLKHINTSAMMDLLLRLISCVEPAQLRQDVLNWLNEAKIIQRLVGLIHPSQDEDRQSNASQTLCDIIRLSRDQSSQLQEAPEADPLLAALESQECVEQLLKNMFDGERTESCVVSGTQALLTLLEPRRAGMEGLVDSFSQGFQRSYYTVSSSILRGIEPRLSDFHQLLLHPPKAASILTTIGVLEEPLGNARLHGARLIAALLHTNTPSINQELCRLNTMDLLLDLFFKYTWNNFLHFQVELCIATILAHSAHESQPALSGTEKKDRAEGNPASGDSDAPTNGHSENIMVTHLFQKCCLVQRIMDAWETNDRIQAEGGMRRGNMGHLTRIANTVVQNIDKGPMQTQISEFITGLPEDCRGRWESFVEETLTEANRRNTVDLVSTHHLHSSSEDEDAEAAFSSELSLQQAFSEYQIQQMTANFVDQFGFNDEEFAEPDDNINAPFDRISEINFNMDADDDSPNAPLFEACCSERIQQFDDSEEEDDIWEAKESSYLAQAKSRMRFGAPHASGGSSRSDLENGDTHGHSLRSSEEEAEQAATPPPDENGSLPEDKSTEPSPEESGWAAVFEPVSSKPPASCVAMDVGSSVWDSSAPDPKTPEERGWAKFTDFQPFCCSEAGPRCSSPVDTEGSDSEGGPTPSQERVTVSAASPCVWNVCVARKAPLVASDSSSSGGSESEEEEERVDMVTETVSTGSGQETTKPTVDAKNRKALFTSGSSGSVVVDKMTSILENRPDKALDNGTAQLHRSPPNSAATATLSEARRDRKEEALPGAETILNGPA